MWLHLVHWLLVGSSVFLGSLSACCLKDGQVCKKNLPRQCWEPLDHELDESGPDTLYTCRRKKNPVILTPCPAGCHQDPQNSDSDICVPATIPLKTTSKSKVGVINWIDNWANGCVFPGNSNNKIVDLQMEGSSCGPKCQEILECTHFEFNPTNKMCRLKRGRMIQSQAVRHGNMICGVRKGAEAVDWSTAIGPKIVTFHKARRSAATTSIPRSAVGNARKDDDCTHYAFNQNDGKCRRRVVLRTRKTPSILPIQNVSADCAIKRP
ncbi:hypothetical protein BV898_15441 [Hypsibius exemplaris]|uniref:Apple domain-containing protein n=1 Tax=Hypsibius exemplaris TaxID=2072580 RepID=A0A9X6NB11_HYPEX|nr:hypothetical protein BV898_15441 [Hypsibius exemplaris]